MRWEGRNKAAGDKEGGRGETQQLAIRKRKNNLRPAEFQFMEISQMKEEVDQLAGAHVCEMSIANCRGSRFTHLQRMMNVTSDTTMTISKCARTAASRPRGGSWPSTAGF